MPWLNYGTLFALVHREVQVGQVWVALGVQDLMGAQCQEAQGMGINTEDSMEHLGKSTLHRLKMQSF